MRQKHLQVILILMVFISSCNLPITPTPASTPQAVETAAISIMIAQPANGTEFPALAPVPVSIQVSGDVQTIELLADGTTFENSKEPKFNRAKWKWFSSAPGLHTLQARATGKDGITYTSNSIILWISPNVSQSTTLYQAQTGDTLTGLAERFNTTPELILNTNPFLPADVSAPLPLDRPIKILNRYPEDIIQAFPKLDFPGQPKKDAASSNSSSQTNFPLNAKLPFDNNTPPLSPELVFVDQVYYYISLDGSPWSRVPRNQGEFLKPKNGFFDLDEILAPLLASAPSKDIHVTVDAWGWQGGALVHIGRFERIIAASKDNTPWVVLPGQLEICNAGTNCSQGEVTGSFAEHVTSNGGNHTLRWQAPPGE
ncbi:MAG: LysM peptidoglycan-binding domain-containing protein [Anaerolineales bacterium]|nr:LysM peptidoglycan-binding domain-containing protein [Anaerolineales bacterium]